MSVRVVSKSGTRAGGTSDGWTFGAVFVFCVNVYVMMFVLCLEV